MRNRTSERFTQSKLSGLSKVSHASGGDGESETETTVLIVPQHGSKFTASSKETTDSNSFFRLPSDGRTDSYFKFTSVDDLDSMEGYLNRDSRPVTYFGRRGRRLIRKAKWEKAFIPIRLDAWADENLRRTEASPNFSYTADWVNGSKSLQMIMPNDFQNAGTK